jgi:hypothetical protein
MLPPSSAYGTIDRPWCSTAIGKRRWRNVARCDHYRGNADGQTRISVATCT